MSEQVIVVGAGPVGLVAAARLVRAGIPVTVLEAGDDLSVQSRASTFHPPTLDMLSELGVAEPLIRGGLRAPGLQYRMDGEVIATFDFGEIADETRHPYRLQSEQSKLTRILHDTLTVEPGYRIEFGARVVGIEQDEGEVRASVELADGRSVTRRGTWLIGADGAKSPVRRSLGIEFEGFTWPERFLVLSTTFDFDAAIPGLTSVNYVADPECWHFFLRIPGMWRVMFPVSADLDDEAALEAAYGQALLARTVPHPPSSGFEVVHSTLYRVHQRVAASFRKGRAFLAGDAAHINNPLGGMGMNGGIHDAWNLTGRLAAVIRGEEPNGHLDGYDRQRRQVTVESVQVQTIQNKRDLEARTEEDRRDFRDRLRDTAADPARRHAFLERVSMIASLRRAESIA